MEQQRKTYLDVIRILACLMVIMMHSPIPGNGALVHGPFLTLSSYLTSPCVPLFFMVSGALLLPCADRITTSQYITKRIGKILGPTICFSIFYISLKINYINKKDLIQNILSIPFSAQGHSILWFMYTLTGLYLLIPIISPWIKNASKKEIKFYLLLWFVTMLYPYIGLILRINDNETNILYYFAGYAGYFLLGYYLNRYPVSLKLLFPLAILMLPLPLLNKVFSWNLDFYSAFWYLSAPVAIITATWFVGIKRLCETFVFNIRLSIISNLSFGIYLIHIFIMRTLLWNWSVITEIPNYYLQTVIIAVFTFVGSYVVCRIISYIPYSQYIIGYTEKRQRY